MGLVLECDGCEKKLDGDTAKKYGRIEPAYYCEECAKEWERYIELEKGNRNEMLATFAAWRKAAQKDLDFKRVPDA